MMNLPTDFQPSCCSIVGHVVHKFAELPLFDEKKKHDLAEKVAAFTVCFFIVLPTLSIASIVEAALQVPKLMRAPFSRFVLESALDCLHTLITALAFPVLVLGSAFVGKLPLANRFPRFYFQDIVEALNSSNWHLAQHLIHEVGRRTVGDKDGKVQLIRYLISHLTDYSAYDYDSFYQALFPTITSLTEEERMELLCTTEFKNKEGCCVPDAVTALLWTIPGVEGEEALYKTREHFLELTVISREALTQLALQSPGYNDHYGGLFKGLVGDSICGLIKRFAPPSPQLHPYFYYMMSEKPFVERLMRKESVIRDLHAAFHHTKSQVEEEILATTHLPTVLVQLISAYFTSYAQKIQQRDYTISSKLISGQANKVLFATGFLGRSENGWAGGCEKILERFSNAAVHSIEKKVFSFHMRGYHSAKFLGAITLGTYFFLEKWVITPLAYCTAFFIAGAVRIAQFMKNIYRFISDPTARSFNALTRIMLEIIFAPFRLIKAVAFSMPYVILILALDTFGGQYGVAKPVVKGLNLYLHCVQLTS